MGRKSSAHRDQLGQISLLQREIKLPICALTMFRHQFWDSEGLCVSVRTRLGLSSPSWTAASVFPIPVLVV